MMGARELLPVFFSYCRRMLRAFLLVALGGAMLFVVTILYRAPLELPLYTCCLVGAVGAVFFFPALPGITAGMPRCACCVPSAPPSWQRCLHPGIFWRKTMAISLPLWSATVFLPRQTPPTAKPMRRNIIRFGPTRSKPRWRPCAFCCRKARISLAAAPLPRSCSRPNSMWTWCWAICALVLSMPISRRRRSLWRPLCGRA